MKNATVIREDIRARLYPPHYEDPNDIFGC